MAELEKKGSTSSLHKETAAGGGEQKDAGKKDGAAGRGRGRRGRGAEIAAEAKKKLVARVLIGEIGSEVFCVRFSPDGQLVAAGCADGGVRLYNTETGRLAYHFNVGLVNGLPMCCLRFRPTPKAELLQGDAQGKAPRSRNVLLTANANGNVQHWHVFSGKNINTITEENNQVYALDYSSDGWQFCTAGKDYAVRVYDEVTKTCVVKMSGGADHYPPGHSNRVFSVKFHPEDKNILISGGWDNTVQIWDVRNAMPVRSIYGPHICGDALDLVGNFILTGSWTPQNQLQVWDYGTGQSIETIPFQSGIVHDRCYLYAAQFSKASKGELIIAGGSGANECRVFDRASKQVVGNVTGLTKGVYACDFSENDRMIAVGGAESSIRIYDVVDLH